MAIPLVMLGPGGDYQTRYQIKGQGLIRQAAATLEQQPDTETAGSMAGWDRLPRRGGQDEAGDEAGQGGSRWSESDRFEHASAQAGAGTYDAAGRVREAAADKAMHAALLAWLGEQGRALADQLEPVRRLRREMAVAVWRKASPTVGHIVATDNVSGGSIDKLAKEQDHESDPQATAHSHTHPRHSAGPRLLADDAGTRRRARSEQGHRLRTRRGAHQKRGFGSPAQQGSLFGG